MAALGASRTPFPSGPLRADRKCSSSLPVTLRWRQGAAVRRRGSCSLRGCCSSCGPPCGSWTDTCMRSGAGPCGAVGRGLGLQGGVRAGPGEGRLRPIALGVTWGRGALIGDNGGRVGGARGLRGFVTDSALLAGRAKWSCGSTSTAWPQVRGGGSAAVLGGGDRPAAVGAAAPRGHCVPSRRAVPNQ